MLRECWGPVFAALDTRPVPDELIPTVDGRIVVLGRYRGAARESGREHDAVFAHVLSFRDGKVSALTQITDSQRWHDALI
jgi:ketosteroid isomerase-like protein